MVCSQKNLPLSNAATLSCLEPQAMSSNHSPEMRIAWASTFFSSSILCRYKPSSEKQSMMEDSRWSVESVTKQVVNPSLTCNIVQLELSTGSERRFNLPSLQEPRSSPPQSLGRSRRPRSSCKSLSTCRSLHLIFLSRSHLLTQDEECKH